MQQVLSDVEEVKRDVGEVKCDVEEVKCLCSPTCFASAVRTKLSPGAQIEQDILKWFSPPDPSINYNTACEAQSEGTAAWFFRRTKFKDWMSTGSLMWIHGKRELLLSFIDQRLIVSDFAQPDLGRASSGSSLPSYCDQRSSLITTKALPL